MAVQLHRRDAFLVLGHEVDGLKPLRQGQLGGVEDGSCGDRGLAVAAIALLELAAVQLAASVMATVRAQKPIGPSPLIQGVEALVFGAVEREEYAEADSFLELHWVACHVNFLFLSLSYMAIFYTNSSLDSRVIRNAYGGALLLGVAESGSNPPVATAIKPIPRCHDLAENLKLVFRDCVEPQLPQIDIFGIEQADGAGVVILRSGRSSSSSTVSPEVRRLKSNAINNLGVVQSDHSLECSGKL